jgi:2-amino-4-hydroxy-6-hydroxymethyldihydropteridine diphosphokinase
MPSVFISVGSNIERSKNIGSALKALERQFGDLIVSSVYESEAVGFQGDPFFNLVVACDTKLSIREFADILSGIEAEHGRTQECKKFSSRTLDLDLLLYDKVILHEGKLKLPRDDILQYAFVLEPLAEIAPDLRHPVSGVRYADLWRDFDKRGLRQQRITPWPIS